MKKILNTCSYEQITRNEVITQMLPLFNGGGYYLRDDGKVDCTRRMMPNYDWLHIKHLPNIKCHLWHRVYSEYFNFIPKRCHECWKVVVKPRSLVELCALYDLMVELDRPAKCGIERRIRVFGNYGGYFYNASLEEGLDCKDIVTSQVKRIASGIPVILKHACTEFEDKYGPSDAWEYSEESCRREQVLDNVIVQDLFDHSVPEHLELHILRDWIHFAYDRGDATYKHFTDGKDLFPPIKFYDRPVNTITEPKEVRDG